MQRKFHDERQRRHEARKSRVVRSLATTHRPRMTVFRTSKHIYAQLVDAETGQTLLSVSTRSKAVSEGLSSTGNVEAARRVGQAFAGLARAREIEEVVFNRNGFLYHGRVKALAEAAREAGLKF
ncbi:MAG: 50S ribosomal protein L18 [Myxococcales bacterium]|nr:MAG: 50S ribosomal protein L18 [Myxococcales bacterium]